MSSLRYYSALPTAPTPTRLGVILAAEKSHLSQREHSATGWAKVGPAQASGELSLLMNQGTPGEHFQVCPTSSRHNRLKNTCRDSWVLIPGDHECHLLWQKELCRCD